MDRNTLAANQRLGNPTVQEWCDQVEHTVNVLSSQPMNSIFFASLQDGSYLS